MHHLEEADLKEIGISLATSIELKEALPIPQTIPQENVIKRKPVPPAHPPPAEQLVHRVSEVSLPSSSGKKRPAPPKCPPPESLLRRAAASNTEYVGEIMEKINGKSVPISHTVPQEDFIKSKPAPPAHPPPAEVLAHRVLEVPLPSTSGKKRPAPPKFPPPESLLRRREWSVGQYGYM